MTEPFFFRRPPGLTASEIAELTGAKLSAGAQGDRRVANIAPLDRAGPGDLAFLDRPKYLDQLATTHAGICLIAARFADRAPTRITLLLVSHPYRAFVQVARALFPEALRPSSLREATGVAPQANVHPSARLEAGVSVDPGAVIGPRAEIGAGTLIGANVVIGPDVRVGRDCAIGPGTSLLHALIGDRVIIHPGVHIGQDGYSYMPGPGGHIKIPQVGRVVIQDDVEIGAGTTIDRGASRDTILGEGTKIDNLVQIGHNVTVGRHCIIVSQTGISGSVTLGDYVMTGGQVGIADHLTVGEGAQLAAKAGLMHDVPPGGKWASSFPAKPVREAFREAAVLARLARGTRPTGADTAPPSIASRTDDDSD
jgi:UDP-3-O-[3-hydroxymyristoyl] glucosamine N-acyltransferase